MKKRRHYTPEEDALILAVDRVDITLANQLNCKLKGIQERKRLLQKRLNIEPTSNRPKHYNKAKNDPILPPLFARPAWFEEDINSIARSKR